MRSDPRTLQLELEVMRDERDLYRSLLMADSTALAEFFARAAISIEHMRAALHLPTREHAAFRAKIEQLLDEITRIALAASVLQLPTLIQRLQACEQALRDIQSREDISGNDLLPVMVLIEDLCAHIAVGADAAGMASPLDGLEDAELAAPGASQLQLGLQHIAREAATQHGKRVTLTLIGFDDLPGDWNSTVFDVLGQLVRNAIEHGIETPEVRRTAGKPPGGMLTAEFRVRNSGFTLGFQDDGRGLDTQGIGEAAVGCGLLTQASVATLDQPRLASLIFQNGLTTAVKGDRRGLGMSIVREQVQRLGGQVQIASKHGHFTRYRISLPEIELAPRLHLSQA